MHLMMTREKTWEVLQDAEGECRRVRDRPEAAPEKKEGTLTGRETTEKRKKTSEPTHSLMNGY